MPKDTHHLTPPSNPSDTIGWLEIAEVAEVTADGVMIRLPDRDSTCLAACLGPIGDWPRGTLVPVSFLSGLPTQPVIHGALNGLTTLASDPGTTVTRTSENLTIHHPRKIVLRCGAAVLTMDADGRIELNGEYLLSTSRGTNRITGASVKIN